MNCDGSCLSVLFPSFFFCHYVCLCVYESTPSLRCRPTADFFVSLSRRRSALSLLLLWLLSSYFINNHKLSFFSRLPSYLFSSFVRSLVFFWAAFVYHWFPIIVTLIERDSGERRVSHQRSPTPSMATTTTKIEKKPRWQDGAAVRDQPNRRNKWKHKRQDEPQKTSRRKRNRSKYQMRVCLCVRIRAMRLFYRKYFRSNFVFVSANDFFCFCFCRWSSSVILTKKFTFLIFTLLSSAWNVCPIRTTGSKTICDVDVPCAYSYVYCIS